MKAGDKVYCIKDRIVQGNIYVLKNNFYTVLRCNRTLIYTTTENQYGEEYYIWYVEGYEYNDNKDEIAWLKSRIFSDYFITEKESRKLKLQKLNEKNLYL